MNEQLAHHGLTPEGIQEDTIRNVQSGAAVVQITEKRSEYSHRVYYYKVILPAPGLFPKGLFVEMELDDPDPDVPGVIIVNAHEQK